jgi:hypothetical protein
MNERQHHLNESSSARLGGSQQLEILPNPNSKRTQSLGADFSDGGIALAPAETRLQHDRDAAVRRDGRQQHDCIAGQWEGTRRSRRQSGGAGNQRFQTAQGTRGSRETGNQGTLPMETAESMGARETNEPKERSAAVRRDGKPLANAAKGRRQKETVAEEQQAATGERPSSPAREEMEDVQPLVDDPAGQQHTAAADAGREEAAHKNSESIKHFEEILREEAREMLTGYLRDGTEYLSASTRRRRTRTWSRWPTTWYECARRRFWTGCGQGPSIQVRTRIPIQQGARQVKSWSRIWKRP